MGKSRKIVFLDKDGTIIPDIPYNVDSHLMTLYPDVHSALPILSDFGYEFIVITNQSGVAKGYFEEDKLIGVRQKIEVLFEDIGVELLDFYYCPHDNESVDRGCSCRKPLPGMLYKAANDYDIQLSESWMIGDILNDVEAGNRASCKTVLLDRGNESFEYPGTDEYRLPDIYETNFINLAYTLIHYDLKFKKNGNYKIDSVV